ncbi:asparaginase domain-containing protein [Photobacterium sp. SDRW27]|uniref:asparaginase domain-containing protein n=1 Tax=Photobacterium obscurum TaxID=2829490 RepID=UPI002243128E|nr:asparaginase domain-containing protein [Photobacterium obscurum]MCW8330936.1 asparaginase domain-containing protein [Photobacterium obscurum]
MSSNDNEHKIQIIITGGTIDSYYDIDACTALCHQHTVIPEFITKFGQVPPNEFELCELCMKDSRDITLQDINEMSAAINLSNCNRHIITHGTFTLFDSARRLQTLLPKEHGQSIVFTGAMWPLVGFSPNDAGFNLGSALMAARLAAPGIYIAFNGKLYQPDDLEGLH